MNSQVQIVEQSVKVMALLVQPGNSQVEPAELSVKAAASLGKPLKF
jgi:hypothetical protein